MKSDDADELLEDELPGCFKLDNAWIRLDDVQAWRWYPGNSAIDIWFRHREKSVTFPCDPVSAKAFELAFKNK